MSKKQLQFEGAKPFLKWAGGKGQLLTQYETFYPQNFKRYHEPFLGGGAVYFHLRCSKAFLSDLNEELINVYKVVRDNVDGLVEDLKKHKNEEEYFYSIRELNPNDLDEVERASRLIFLNRTCFNGLYRVNRKGLFNVPFGRYKNPNIVNEKGLRAASVQLSKAHIDLTDFGIVEQRAKKGDFIYFDPPYQPLSVTSSFTDYTSKPFDENEQSRLSELFRTLDRRGCFVMLSNSDLPFIHELYKEFRIEVVQASRAINCKADGRGPINELVILNY